jgi:hypothetical protein
MTVSRATNFTPFWLMFEVEAVLPKEIKHKSFQTTMKALPCPNEAEDKDKLEPDMLKVVANLQKYQDETRAWRDLKVNFREFNEGDLVLLQGPRTERSRKLESKWVRSYVIMEKLRSGAYRLLDSQGKVLEHSWNADKLRHFYI